MAKIQLVVEDRRLCIPLPEGQSPNEFGETTLMLLHVYPEGDCDVCHWPLSDNNPDRVDEILTGSLFAARECGHFPSDVNIAVLPDGQEYPF